MSQDLLNDVKDTRPANLIPYALCDFLPSAHHDRHIWR